MSRLRLVDPRQQDWDDRLAIACEWEERGLTAMADGLVRMVEEEIKRAKVEAAMQKLRQLAECK